MFNILDKAELERAELTIKDRLRVIKSRKQFAVITQDKLYLVNDIDRLFFDRLKSQNIYNATIYQLK